MENVQNLVFTELPEMQHTSGQVSARRFRANLEAVFKFPLLCIWAIYIMAGFDDAGVFFSDNFGSEDQPDDGQISRQQVKNRFRDFIRQFHEGNFSYRYRWVLVPHVYLMLGL